jgi:iron complex transport system substrate-binding protein
VSTRSRAAALGLALRFIRARLARGRAAAVILLVALLELAAAPLAASAAVTVIDDTGRTLTLAHVPQKIISIAPGATEMLFAAGAGPRVIATVEFSDEPAEARKVPRIGDSNAIDIERVVALRPDVVVIWEGGSNAGQVAQLERLGIPLYRHKILRLTDMPPSLRRLGALADTQPIAERAARNVESRLTQLANTYGRGPQLTVLLEVWNRPVYTVGGSHMMTDSLRLCGARNIFDDLKEQGPAVDLEAVIGRNPQVIVAVAPPGVANDWLNEWKRYPTLQAVKNEALVPYEDTRLSRLGPSALGGTEALCQALDRVRHAQP